MRVIGAVVVTLAAGVALAQELGDPILDTKPHTKINKETASEPIPDKYSQSPDLLLEYLKGHRAGTLTAVSESESLGSGRIVGFIGCFFPSDDKENAYADGYQSGRRLVSRATNDVYFRTSRSMLEKFKKSMQKEFPTAKSD